MNAKEFEGVLDLLCAQLTIEAKESPFATSKIFENRVRKVLESLVDGLVVDYDPHPYVFPDIAIGEFGLEVKFTTHDTWRSVANSVFETTRDQTVVHVYVIFGKMGGTPAVKWGRYEDCVMHVRTSHVPRFELEMYPDESLFQKFGVTYEDFCKLPTEGKMELIRKYARGRLKPGDRLWWLDDKPESEHSLPLEVRLYMNLSTEEKRNLRAEGALLCPQIVGGSRQRNKYNDVALYMLTYRGVLSPQTRDLFTAGSVAMRDGVRGGNYLERALADIQKEMRAAAIRLEDALFVEYWEESVPPKKRIAHWLELADGYASGWKPSDTLFRTKRS